jgi:hypothetical protein
MTDEDIEVKKPLTREQILNTNNGSKLYQLPGGKTVHAAFLSLGMVQEIERSLESAAEGEKEHLFALKVVEWMLRNSDQKDYQAFSSEDQHRLIEIAVEEWGCEDEYDQFSDIDDPEVRFYQAVRLQEKELAEQLSESVRAISANLINAIAPLRDLQIELASSITGMLEQFSEVNGFNKMMYNLDARVLEQMGDISRFQPPILGLAGGLVKFQEALGSSTQSMLLDSLGGTITSYKNLMKDVLPIEKFATLPDSVRYFPTIEMHNASIVAGYFLEETTYEPQEDIIEPEISELLEWLGNLDPSFPIMLRGAEQTIYSQNPDHCRHFASSHRELSTHVLHLLAPDNEVRLWTQDPNHYGKDGKPTRRARLKYIARNHNNDTFVDFLIKDFENQMALLNADEHSKTQEYSKQELLTLHKRFLSMLGFLWEIVSSHS